jgi:hypothetical protein
LPAAPICTLCALFPMSIFHVFRSRHKTTFSELACGAKEVLWMAGSLPAAPNTCLPSSCLQRRICTLCALFPRSRSIFYVFRSRLHKTTFSELACGAKEVLWMAGSLPVAPNTCATVLIAASFILLCFGGHDKNNTVSELACGAIYVYTKESPWKQLRILGCGMAVGLAKLRGACLRRICTQLLFPQLHFYCHVSCLTCPYARVQ